jgi:hypothetical protein
MGLFVVSAIVCLVVGWLICGCIIAFVLVGMREFDATVSAQRAALVVLGTILLSPAVAPAGTFGALPLPLGIMLVFVRSLQDLTFFFRMWWFMLPSVIATALVCWLLAKFMFPNYSSKRTR